MLLTDLLPNMIRYRLARLKLAGPGKPINLTFSITNICQSRCRTCNIWKIYKDHPGKKDEELSIEEIERIFRSMGHIYIFNISGGEPFLRSDLEEIIAAACRYLTPGLIHIPTNAIAQDRVIETSIKIIDFLKRYYPKIRLTIKPSLDHIDKRHDEIRGVTGNYEKVISVFQKLKSIQPEYPNLHVELGTVISRWNVSEIEEIASKITKLEPDSYRNEIAEQRSEMLNTDDPITPDPEQYQAAIAYFVDQLRRNMRNQRRFNRITNAFRLEYYNLAIRILKTRRQVIPCYAGISNAHMTPYGDIWACCTLGYGKSMGNLREFDYNFRSLWNSPRAEEIRKHISEGNCSCPMANQMYSNILMDPPSLMRVLYNIGVNHSYN